MVTAAAWHQNLVEAVTAFEDANNVQTTQVHVYLEGDETLHVLEVVAVPGEDLLALSPYPDDLRQLRRGQATGVPVSPRMVLVEPRRIMRVELRVPPDREKSGGFRPPDRPEIKWPPVGG
jgi:hypothetical protein